MNIPKKWLLAGVVVALLSAGALRALSARETATQALEAQQATQKRQAAIEVTAADVLHAHTIELTETLQISGSVKAVHSAFVQARVVGELQGPLVREGDHVKAGQVIARIEATEYQARLRQAQQQAESAKAQVDIVQRSLNNNKSLVDQGFISRTALDNSLNTVAVCTGNLQGRASGRGAGCEVLG